MIGYIKFLKFLKSLLLALNPLTAIKIELKATYIAKNIQSWYPYGFRIVTIMSIRSNNMIKNPNVEYLWSEWLLCLIIFRVKSVNGNFHINHEKNKDKTIASAFFKSSV